MLVRLMSNNSSPTNSNIIDSKYDPKIKNISITAPGVVVAVESESDDNLKWFIPWHQIKFIMGTQDDFGHELEQFFYLGVSE